MASLVDVFAMRGNPGEQNNLCWWFVGLQRFESNLNTNITNPVNANT